MQLYAGQSGDVHPNLKTLDDMIAFKDGLPVFRDPFPEWLHQTIEMLRDATDSMRIGSGRVRMLFPTPPQLIAIPKYPLQLRPPIFNTIWPATFLQISLPWVIASCQVSLYPSTL